MGVSSPRYGLCGGCLTRAAWEEGEDPSTTALAPHTPASSHYAPVSPGLRWWEMSLFSVASSLLLGEAACQQVASWNPGLLGMVPGKAPPPPVTVCCSHSPESRMVPGTP